ncbi:MAG: prephenate dehydratase [bacterium]
MAKKTTGKKAAKAVRRPSLATLRRRLDSIDADLLEKLSERTRVVLDVKAAKQHNGGRIWVPEREAEQLERLLVLNAKAAVPVPESSLRAIFGEVLSSSRSLQGALRVAYLGPEGTYSELAAREQFGSQAELVPVGSIAEVFAAAEKGQADLGIVPFENSTEGIVAQTLDSFVDSPLRIFGEHQLEIRHALLSNAKSLAGVRRVLAHPQALAQCREWLGHNLPDAETLPVSSNAEAARQAARTRTTAAIAGVSAGRRYDLGVLASGIQDIAPNVTRFVVVGGGEQATPERNDKISVLFSVKNEVGVLAKILAPLARAGIDVLKIESRPRRGWLWDYIFFVDLRADPEQAATVRALASMRRRCVWLKVLGTYAAARTD